jgi:hypothetical protein
MGDLRGPRQTLRHSNRCGTATDARTTLALFHSGEVFYMRFLQILGAILVLGGLFVLIKSPSYSSEKSLLKIGDVEAKVSQQQVIPPWVGGAGVVAGAILLVVGARKP